MDFENETIKMLQAMKGNLDAIDIADAIYDEETKKTEQETEQIKEEITEMLKALKETA